MTAYQTGTASSHVDLWDKLLAFLTTDPTLVAAGDQWTTAWLADDSNSGNPNDTDIVLRGPGSTGTDNIYVGLRREDNVPEDNSTFYVYGMTGVVPNAEQVTDHINVTPRAVKMFSKTTPMNYWFVASGRRFIVVIKVGTIYQALYAGFFLAYGTLTQYSYPLFIGAAAGDGGPTEAADWRDVTTKHSLFPFASYSEAATGWETSAWLLSPQGDWLRCAADRATANVALGPNYFGTGLGLGESLIQDADTGGYGYKSVAARVVEAYGGGFALAPISLNQFNPADQALGVLDGVYQVTGRGQSPENLISVDDRVHVVFSNAFRTAIDSWFAVEVFPENSNSLLVEDSNSP